MSEYVYINMNENHFKVWGFDFFSNHQTGESNVITYYGKIGTPMQKLRKTNKFFNSFHSAFDYANNKIKEKLQKGYSIIKNHIYFNAIEENKKLTDIIKILEKEEE